MSTPHRHAEFAELAHALGVDPNLALHIDSTIVHLDVRTGSKGALLGARFRIDVAQEIAPYTILMRHEGGLDRAGKNMGVNREVQLGDAAFDKDVYIETDGQDDDVQRILRSAGVREAVREIVTARIENLTMGGDSFVEGAMVPASCSLRVDFATKAFRDVDGLRQVASALARLAREVSRVEPRDPYRGDAVRPAIKPATKDRNGRGIALFLFCVAVNLVGWWKVGFGSTPPTFGWAAFKMGALAGVLAWVLFVVLSGLLLRGRSTSLRNVGIFALFALPTIMAGGRVAEMINAVSDSSAAHVVMASVRLRPQSKGGPRSEVTLPSIDEHVDVGEPHKSAVPFTSTPQPVEATIRDGALGSPYLVSLALGKTR